MFFDFKIIFEIFNYAIHIWFIVSKSILNFKLKLLTFKLPKLHYN